MFSVCVGLVFCSKYVQFPIICSLQYSININTVEVDPPLRFTAYLHSETQELEGVQIIEGVGGGGCVLKFMSVFFVIKT